jgi:hypothetical protein
VTAKPWGYAFLQNIFLRLWLPGFIQFFGDPIFLCVCFRGFICFRKTIGIGTSVADPDPNLDPLDPHVFGPPGSFYHQAKKVRKTLIPTALLLLFDFLSLKMMYEYMYLQKVKSKKTFSISTRHGSADPDPDPYPPQNVMDPQH